MQTHAQHVQQLVLLPVAFRQSNTRGTCATHLFVIQCRRHSGRTIYGAPIGGHVEVQLEAGTQRFQKSRTEYTTLPREVCGNKHLYTSRWRPPPCLLVSHAQQHTAALCQPSLLSILRLLHKLLGDASQKEGATAERDSLDDQQPEAEEGGKEVSKAYAQLCPHISSCTFQGAYHVTAKNHCQA